MIEIDNNKIGNEYKPFIIAEMSGNHNSSLEHALNLIDVASEAGVQAIKFQTYTPDTMTINSRDERFVINDKNSLWYGSNLYELYEKAHTPWEWHEELFSRAKEKGLVPFSTPFDKSAVDFLEELQVPCYKISSFEITDYELIKYVGGMGKPVIMSTGMATVSELGEAVATLKIAGCKDIILLKCTSNYPASPLNSNILTIPHMGKLFDCEVGISDHTLGLGVAVAAVAHGANVIEKHYTMSRTDSGVDSAFSMEPAELGQLVIESCKAWQSLGSVKYGPSESELESLKYRRSLYVTKDLKAGEELTSENLNSLRPCIGLTPLYYNIVLGRKVKTDVVAGTPLEWPLLLE